METFVDYQLNAFRTLPLESVCSCYHHFWTSPVSQRAWDRNDLGFLNIFVAIIFKNIETLKSRLTRLEDDEVWKGFSRWFDEGGPHLFGGDPLSLFSEP